MKFDKDKLLKEYLDWIDFVQNGDVNEVARKDSSWLQFRTNRLSSEALNSGTIPLLREEVFVSPSKLLKEGLIETYPISILQKTLYKLVENIGVPPTLFAWKPFGYSQKTGVADKVHVIVSTDQLFNEIEDCVKIASKKCGYTLGHVATRRTLDGAVQTIFQLEANYPARLVNLPDKLYHVTKSSVVPKILRNGLCPSCKCAKNFKYKDRNYFFVIGHPSIFKQYAQTSGKGQDFSVLEIDRKMCKNVEFYIDPNINPPIAAWTYDNIPPQAIKIVDNFSLNS